MTPTAATPGPDAEQAGSRVATASPEQAPASEALHVATAGPEHAPASDALRVATGRAAAALRDPARAAALRPEEVLALQGATGNAVVAGLLRQAKPAAPEPKPLERLAEFHVDQDAKGRKTVVRFRDTPWVTVTWRGVAPTITLGDFDRDFVQGVAIKVACDDPCTITVDRSVEDAIFSTRGGLQTGIAYDLHCDGSVEGLVTTIPKAIRTPVRLWVKEYRGFAFMIPEGGSPERSVERTETWESYEIPDSDPSFDNLADLRAAIARKPRMNGVVIQMPDGRYVLRELSERELRRIAEDARRSIYKPEQLEQVSRYRSKRGRGTFVGLMLEGVEYHALDDLANRFFSDPFFAGVGPHGAPKECEVFSMGRGSFGRKPLSHAEALARLEEIDRLTPAQVDALETEAGHRFHALWVAGASGRVHELDDEYVAAREEFRAGVRDLDAAPDSASRARIVERMGRALRAYVLFEADRERPNPAMVRALRTHGELAGTAQLYLYTQVADYAQSQAIELLVAGADQIHKVIDSDVALAAFARDFAQKGPQQRADALALLGVPADKVAVVTTLLTQPETVLQLTWSQTVTAPGGEAFDLDVLRGYARSALTGIDDIVGQLRGGKLRAIEVGGPFGNNIRALAYRRFGFNTLAPAAYPHKDRTPFLPSPASGDLGQFSNLGELMFADQARLFADVETIKTATVIAIGMAAVIISAGVAGAAVAGLFFAEGTLLYFAASGAVAGFLMAGAELGVRGLAGEELSAGEVAKTLAGGTATGAVAGVIFGGLGRLLKGANAALRFTAMGAGFLAFSAADHRLKTGKWPTEGPDFPVWLYENLLTFVLVEAGGVAARPLNERVGIWARAKRLGVLPENRAAFRAEASRLNKDFAALAVRPQRAGAEGPAMRDRYVALLKRQRALVLEAAGAIRGVERSAELEQELAAELAIIDAQLKSIESAGFLTAFKIKPVGESKTLFEYTRGPDAKARFEDFFGALKGRVVEEPDGTLLVTMPGESAPFVFQPAGTAPAPVPAPAAAGDASLVDLNSATVKELVDKVPGIGKARAEQIVARREKSGPFTSVDDVLPLLGKAAFAKAAPVLTVKPPAPPRPLGEVRAGLAARQNALLERADRVAVSDPAVERVRKINVEARRTSESLAEAEKLIAAAEQSAGPKMDQVAKRAFDAARNRPGVGAKGIEAARADAFESMSDTEFGEAMLQLRGLREIGPAQVRAALHAHRARLDLTRFLKMSTGFGVAERNFALETYARLKDARVPGAEKVITDMGRGRKGWSGGMWALEAARYEFGIEKLAALEVRESREGVIIGDQEPDTVAREYDVVLKDGKKVELKSWPIWDEQLSGKLAKQFIKDMILGRYDPAALKTYRYVFREPVPKTAQQIKAFLRGVLARHLNAEVAANHLTSDQAGQLLRAFDQEAGLVLVSKARWTGGPMIDTPQPAAVPLPPPDDDRERKAPQIPVPPQAPAPAPAPRGEHD